PGRGKMLVTGRFAYRGGFAVGAAAGAQGTVAAAPGIGATSPSLGRMTGAAVRLAGVPGCTGGKAVMVGAEPTGALTAPACGAALFCAAPPRLTGCAAGNEPKGGSVVPVWARSVPSQDRPRPASNPAATHRRTPRRRFIVNSPLLQTT